VRDEVLAAVCDTFAPAVDGLPSASQLGVPERIQGEVAALNRPQQVAQLNRLLDTLDSPLLNLALSGRLVRFSRLAQAEREAFLRGWSGSRLPLKRAGFQVLKRLTLLYTYGAVDSPYWKLVGYARPPLPDPAAPPRLRMRQAKAGETIDADVCVIGSGAGGSVFAAEMAKKGRHVVILERARLQTEADFKGGELEGAANLFLDRGLAATSDAAMVLLAGSTVGGGTVVNWNTCLRLPAAVRDEWAAAGIEDALDEHYTAIEKRLDVDTDESPRNGQNAVLERGLLALGLPSQTIARNTRGCGDCGHCGSGCRIGAKQSTLRTYLVDACDGGAEIVTGCSADRIQVKQGAVEGVIAQVEGGAVMVRAPMVALAAGALHSPAILLRSGLASEQAGRNLHLHPTGVVAGRYAEPTPGWVGVPQSVMGDAFADLSPGYGFRLECPPALPGLLAASLPWTSSAEHRRRMSQALHTTAFIAIVRDREGGRVTLDRTGQPVVHYWPGREAREHLVRAMVESARIHLAAGAQEVGTLHTPPVTGMPGGFEAMRQEIERRGLARNAVALFSAHQMSTCRIGRDRRSSVADPNGEVWGVRGLYVTDASAFPSASGVNPMLTVMAMARRTAERLSCDKDEQSRR